MSLIRELKSLMFKVIIESRVISQLFLVVFSVVLCILVTIPHISFQSLSYAYSSLEPEICFLHCVQAWFAVYKKGLVGCILTVFLFFFTKSDSVAEGSGLGW